MGGLGWYCGETERKNIHARAYAPITSDQENLELDLSG